MNEKFYIAENVMKQKQEEMEAKKKALDEKSEILRQELNEKAKALGLAQD